MPSPLRLLVLVLLALTAGCSSRDTETLARIGRKSVERMDAASAGNRNRLLGGWQALRGSLSQASADSRVATRLRWDQQLGELDIRVRSMGPGIVRLEGMVPEGEMKKRALEMAHSTLGVEKVEDELKTEENSSGKQKSPEAKGKNP
jgi:osmotically-inducible protein OsmY